MDDLDRVVGGAASPYGPNTQAGDGSDAHLSEIMNGIQEKASWLETANAVMTELHSERPAGADQVVSYGTVTVDGQEVRVEDWMTANGIEMDNNGDNAGFKSEFETAISNLKGSIDTVSGQSQMDMVRLQSLMAARNASFDQMTDTLSNTGKNMDAVIGNPR